MKKFLMMVLLLIALLVGATYFLLPVFIKSSIESYLHEKIPAQHLVVNVKNINPVRFLMGYIGYISATGEDVDLDKIVYDQIDIELEDVQFDLPMLLQDRKFTIKGVSGGRIEAKIGEKAIEKYLNEETSIHAGKVKISSRQIEVSGDIDLAHILKGRVQVLGEAVLANNRLLISPTGIRFNNSGISGLGANLMEPILLYDFNHFPFPINANKLEMKDGTVTVMAIPRKE